MGRCECGCGIALFFASFLKHEDNHNAFQLLNPNYIITIFADFWSCFESPCILYQWSIMAATEECFAALFDLPYHIILSVFEKWLYLSDMAKLDTATHCSQTSPHCNKREIVLSCLSNPNAIFTGISGTTRVDVFTYTRWVSLRNVTILRNLCIKNGYKHICKKVPSLNDVVGSVDSGTARTGKTEHASGGVFNYTPDSIEQILLAMNLPEGGMRFLDAGCGNALFATLIQMSFPSAEVSV